MHDPISTTIQPSTDALEHALDQRLSQALAPPPLPAHFRARLLAVTAQGQAGGVLVRKRALEREYAASCEQLRSGQVRLQRDTAALILGIVFTAGVCAHRALPWLHTMWGVEAAVALPALAVLIGLAAGASVWVERFGIPCAVWRPWRA